MKRSLFCQIALILTILMSPKLALADIGGLTKCSDSIAFNKRLTATIKKFAFFKSSISLININNFFSF